MAPGRRDAQARARGGYRRSQARVADTWCEHSRFPETQQCTPLLVHVDCAPRSRAMPELPEDASMDVLRLHPPEQDAGGAYLRKAVRMSAPLIEFPADEPDRARRFWHGVLGVELTPRPAAAGAGWETETGSLRLGVHARGRGSGDTGALPYFTAARSPSQPRRHPANRRPLLPHRDSAGRPSGTAPPRPKRSSRWCLARRLLLPRSESGATREPHTTAAHRPSQPRVVALALRRRAIAPDDARWRPPLSFGQVALPASSYGCMLASSFA
jgi:hypothetical protein